MDTPSSKLVRAIGKVRFGGTRSGHYFDEDGWQFLLEAVKEARAALAVLPVDRVGVEPLDVEPDHEHYWIDAPDDETGWFCTICRVTEHPFEGVHEDDVLAESPTGGAE